jgi:hypothetical protein
MKHTSKVQRPYGRIGHVLSRLKKIWHYYPEHSLMALVLETSIYANEVNSELPLTCMAEIEDIAYPEGHLLHQSRNLEMGIDALEKRYKNDPLPPVPIQTALLGKVADHWRKHPQMRLGQILSNEHLMAGLEEQCFANDN